MKEDYRRLNILRKENDYVFTTGGIGPTHDDITAQSVAKAFGLKYEVHKQAFKILEAYYKPGEFNEGRQKMVWMPENASRFLIQQVVLLALVLIMCFVYQVCLQF